MSKQQSERRSMPLLLPWFSAGSICTVSELGLFLRGADGGSLVLPLLWYVQRDAVKGNECGGLRQ